MKWISSVTNRADLADSEISKYFILHLMYLRMVWLCTILTAARPAWNNRIW